MDIFSLLWEVCIHTGVHSSGLTVGVDCGKRKAPIEAGEGR